MMHIRALLFAACFAFIASLHLASAQDVRVDVVQNFATFNHQEDVAFERICDYQGSDSQFDYLEWLLNGSLYKSSEDETVRSRLQLFIRPVNFSHAGQWSCRAAFSGGSFSTPVNTGSVTVFDPNDVQSPPQQYALINQPYTFNCSSLIPNSFVSWIRSGQQPNPIEEALPPLQLSDEGAYRCRVSVMGASIEMPIQLNVIVPPRILSSPQLNQTFGNQEVTLSVTFQSHQPNTTIVRWYINNTLIRSNITSTTYGAPPNATTQIRFSPIARENRGTYRVEVENTAGIIPANMRTAVTTFDVIVRVPPSLPTGITFTLINETHAMITWTLTNGTPDAGAETLFLHLQNHPNSPFELEPTQSQWILYSEPGMMYNLSLIVSNPDGVLTTNPMPVKLPPTAPRVEDFRALRVNATAFNFTLQVAYTGGGDIVEFAVRLRENGMSTFVSLGNLAPVQSISNPRLWFAVLSDERFANLMDPEFQVITSNFLEQSTSSRVLGMDVLPGPPNVLLTSASSNSLSLQLQVSDIGTAPILLVQLNVTLGSELITSMEWTGSFVQRELIDVVVMSLEPNTIYTCRTRATNSVGRGNVSMGFEFTTGDPPGLLPQWGIIAIAVGGSIVLAAILVTTILCVVHCCRKKGYRTSGKYNTQCASVMNVPEEIKRSNETLNSASHRGSVRGGVVGAYTSVPLTPRSPTIESCDSPYTKQRFESVSDSDGSRSDIHIQNPHFPRHYTYSHSPGPSGITPNVHHVPNPLNIHMNNRLSKSLTAFNEEPTSPQSVSHQATMV